MGNYIVKKIVNTCITLFGVVTVIFFLFNILPGDPARMMLGQNEDADQLKIVQKKYRAEMLQKKPFSMLSKKLLKTK